MATSDRTDRQPFADSDLADATGRDDCSHATQRQRRQRNSDGATVGVIEIGGAIVACCAGPALLSTGLLSAGAGVVFDAGAIGVIAVTAPLVGLRSLRCLRIDTAAHRSTPRNTSGPTTTGTNSSDDSAESRQRS